MTDHRRPTDSVLARYLSGECTPDEAWAVERWLGEDGANRQELERLAAAWGRPRETAEMRPAPDVEAFWQRLRKRIEASGLPEVRVVRRPRSSPTFALGARSRWSTAMRVAAAITLVTGAGLAGRTLLDAPAKPAELTHNVVSTTRGQRLSVRLADGTLVALAPSTTMRIPSTYGIKERTVQLEGEAAFTVTHDSTRPFAVETRLAVARDLGTRFLVRAYADDPLTDVVVAEGLVAVGRADSAGAGAPLSSDSLVVARGERVRVGPAGRLALTRGVPLDRYFGWTDGQLVFRRTPLREAITQIERWYDIEIRLAPSGLGERGVTATFGDYEPAAHVLQVIATVLEVEIVETGAGKYMLRVKKQ